ncbi:MAG: hypothetical protein NTY65_12995, partial [Planctomycetota bacterium]|nr:hypothetical protein [Planctomycetota bacterium]
LHLPTVRLPQPHLRPDFTARFDLVIVHGHSYSALVLKKRAKKSQALSTAKNAAAAHEAWHMALSGRAAQENR